jgi:hypothetical protein
MHTWHSKTTVPGSPADILAFLTEPEAIARWAPVPFEVLALDGDRLRFGSHARVAGHLAIEALLTADALRLSLDPLIPVCGEPPASQTAPSNRHIRS